MMKVYATLIIQYNEAYKMDLGANQRKLCRSGPVFKSFNEAKAFAMNQKNATDFIFNEELQWRLLAGRYAFNKSEPVKYDSYTYARVKEDRDDLYMGYNMDYMIVEIAEVDLR